VWTSSGGIFDLPGKEARLEKLDAEMASPAFWDDNRRAQELIRERADLARTVARVSELARQASDLGVLLELAQESGDDGSLDAEITEGAAKLRAELDEFELKVMGAIRMARLVIPHMKKRGGGRIINVTTVGGKAPRAQGLPTSVSRAAGINLTKSLANEYAGDRILVNTICIGLVKSAQIARRAKDGDVEAHYRELAKRVPVGRVAEASEFGDLVAFLASERASYITGTAINFDGGMSFTV